MKTENQYQPTPVKITSYKKETDDCFTIRFNWTKGHDAGQFMQVSLPAIGECPISICSYSDKYIEMNIRNVGVVTNALSKLKVGDEIFVRGPYGHGYPVEEFKGKNIVIVGGGTGVAPLKGVVEYVKKFKEDFKDVKLFFGFRNPDSLLFKEDLNECAACFNLTTSFDKIPPECAFKGNEGFVTAYVEKANIDPKNTIGIVCGPPMMIKIAAEILKKKGFKNEQIYTSMERLMFCGVGKCGHCMIHGKYCCKDGPVFRYDEIEGYKND